LPLYKDLLVEESPTTRTLLLLKMNIYENPADCYFHSECSNPFFHCRGLCDI